MPNVIRLGVQAGKLTMRINATQLWATGFSLSGNVDISPVAAIDESTATQGPLVHDRTVVHDQAAPVPGRNDVVEIVGRAYYNEGPTFTFRSTKAAGSLATISAPSGALVGSSFDGGTTAPSIPTSVARPRPW